MADNPLKYSDLIQKDDSIAQLITELEKLNTTYAATLKTVEEKALKVKVAVEGANGATEAGREIIKKQAAEADRLAKAQKELAFAMSEVGQQVASLKLVTAEKNGQTREEYKLSTSQTASYREMKANLALLRAEYQAMSKNERESTVAGQQKLSQIIELNSQVQAINRSMRAHNITQDEEIAKSREVKAVLTDLEKARLRLTFATSDENAELMQLNMETKRAAEVARLNIILNNEVEGSYNKLSAQYSLNKIKLNEMSMEWRETTAEGKAFVAQTNNIYQQMNKMQMATGKHTLSVGNYAKGWDGLGNSVSQLTRELPALAMSANMFFLAISNNIPIMADEINRLKDRNKALNAEGVMTVPIWKSVLKSFASFNTIMMIGVSLLTIFGGDLVDWVKKMISAKDAVDETTKSMYVQGEVMKGLRAASLKGQTDAQAETIRLGLLYKATQNQSKGMRERLAAVKELQEKYPDYFGNLTNEEILAGNAATAYTNLASAIIKSAMARAAEGEIVKNSEKLLKLDKERAIAKSQEFSAEVLYNNEKERRGGASLKADIALRGKMGVASKAVADGAQKEGIKEGELRREYEKKAAALKKIDQQMLAITKTNEKLAEGINVDTLINPPSEKPKKGKEEKDRTLEINKKNLEAFAKYQESETAILQEGIEKRKQAIIDSFDKERLEIENQIANEKDLTEESKQKLRDTIVNMNLKLMNDLGDVEEKGMMERLKLDEQYLNLRLELVEKGTQEEADLKILIMENARQRELIENDQLTVEMRQSEAAINKKWDELIAKQRLENQDTIAKASLDKMQAYEESVFNLIEHSSYKTNMFRLKQEKERWEATLKSGMANGKKLTEIEIKTINNIIKGIEREMDGQDKDIYDMIGLDLSDEQKGAISESANFVMSNIKDIMNAEIEMADAAIKKAEERVSAAQSALDKEIEARNAGYAHSVASAQKALDLEKKSLQKSQKEKEKAVKAQQALDSVSQLSSLITATAGIWAAFGKMGFLGVAFAIAMTALMFGSFAVSKVKARQATKAQSYGEGGYEVLQGGSHASGNDIPIGTTKDGRARKAEGGEMLAVIKKSSTRKYRSVLPGIINSLNKGNFEQKYLHSYDTGTFNINMGQSLDTKELEDDVKAIKEQGTRKKYFVNGKGETVEIYKNRVRIYK